MKQLRKFTILVTITIASLFGLIGTNPVLAISVCDAPNVSPEVQKAAGCSNTNAAADNDLQTTLTNILNAIIGVAGLIAVIFIIIGGINYITSTGDPTKTKKAKDTILYALIGLIICALAFAIVNWAISAINNSSTPSDANTPADANTPTP